MLRVALQVITEGGPPVTAMLFPISLRSHASHLCALVGAAFVMWFASACEAIPADQMQRDLNVMPKMAPGSVPIAGDYTAARKDSDVQILQADPAGCTWVESKASVSFGEH